MRAVARDVLSTIVFVASVLAFLVIFNTFQFGACHYFNSTCGTSLDWLIPGWRREPYHEERLPGVRWKLVDNVSSQEKLRLIRELGLDQEPDEDPYIVLYIAVKIMCCL